MTSVQRLGTNMEDACDPPCIKPCGSQNLKASMTGQSTRDQEAMSPIDFSRLNQLRIFNQQREDSSENELVHLTTICKAPTLRAISTYTSLLNSGLRLPEHLTHLQLECTQYPQHTLNLPLLKYLHLFMDIKPYVQNVGPNTLLNCSSFESWTFPALVTFRLDGTVNEEDWVHTKRLVNNCSATVINFIADFDLSAQGPFFMTYRPPVPLIPFILDSCANLAAFGLPVSSIVSKISNSSIDSHPTETRNPKGPHSLLIMGMTTFDEYRHEKIDDFQQRMNNSSALEVLLGPSESRKTHSSFQRLVFPYTWSELGGLLNEQHETATRRTRKSLHHPSVLVWAFLSHFIGRGLDIADREGVVLGEKEMRIFDSGL
ncbi:hypothetical protein FRC17_002565 [Serendipita sp. 399]|nr:hypothetical protein FRC17_002565 [Serendipita sp. 399]